VTDTPTALPTIDQWSLTPYPTAAEGPPAPEEATVVRRTDRSVVVRGTVYGRNGCAKLTGGPPELDDGTLTVTIGVGYSGGAPDPDREVGTETPRRACTHVIKAIPYEFRIRFSRHFEGEIDITEGGYDFDADRVYPTETNDR
jgi:hypothetical protein